MKERGLYSVEARSILWNDAITEWEDHSSVEWAIYKRELIERQYGFEDENQRKLKEKQSPSTLKGARTISLPKKLGES